jgi:hypothetical protein
VDKRPLVNQRGVALLLFLVVLIAIAGIFVSNLLGSKVEAVNRSKIVHDYEVLSKAKQALLSYAVNYSLPTPTGGLANMGILPCPDLRTTSSSGAQDSPCGNLHTNSAGFLPWKTLGIDSLRDSSGECLWYVVSGDYKTGPKARMRNEDSNGLLQVQDENGLLYHGENPDDRPIALIITPGGILQGQSHLPDCQGNSNEVNYLESGGSVHHATGASFNYTTDHADIADKIWTYVYGTASSRLDNSNFNDKMVWITKDEYWDAVKAQGDLIAADPNSAINILTKGIAECLTAYANHEDNIDSSLDELRRWLPLPAQVDLNDYRTDAEYTDQAGRNAGRLPRYIDDSQAAAKIDIGNADADLFSKDSSIPECAFTDEQQKFWKNWKDHFFYIVSQDYMINASPSKVLFSRCGPDDVPSGACITVDDINKAAVVFYADSVTSGQSRNTVPEEKNLRSNYLEQSNAHDYTGATNNDYHSQNGDFSYCISVDFSDFPPKNLIAEPCNDNDE